MNNLQLGVDESTAKPALHDSHNQILVSLQQVFRITRSNVTPIFFSSGFLAYGWCDIDTAEFSADDWCTWYVSTAGLSSDGIDKNVVVAFLVDNALDGCTSLSQRRRFCVVVEGSQIRDDMLPAAVIVDASSRVQSSVEDQPHSQIKIVGTYFVM